MPRLEDLRKSLRLMTPEELREKMRELRADRRISKVSPKKRKTQVKAAVKSKTSLQKALGQLSVEEQIALLEGMESAK